MRIWTQPVSGVGVGAQTCLTPNALNLFVTPGTVITSSTDPSGGFLPTLWPDQYGFGGPADMTQAPNGFFGVIVDTAP